MLIICLTYSFSHLRDWLTFSLTLQMQLQTLPTKKITISVVAQEDLSTTVKFDNTLAYEWQTEIYHAAVPCSGMKKGLRLYFAAVTLLIISTGMAQT